MHQKVKLMQKSKIKPFLEKIIDKFINSLSEQLNTDIKSVITAIDELLNHREITLILEPEEQNQFLKLCKRDFNRYVYHGTLLPDKTWTSKNQTVPYYVANYLHKIGISLPLTITISKNYEGQIQIKIRR